MPLLLSRIFSSDDVTLEELANLRPPVHTVEALLEREVDQLVRESRLSRKDVLSARRRAARACVPNFVQEEEEWGVSSGSDDVDGLLGPFAFPAGTVCEVDGPSGAGKTQLCLKVAANAVSGGREVQWIQAGTCSFYEKRFLKILGRKTLTKDLVSTEFVGDAQALVRCLENGSAPVVVVDSPCAVLSPNLGGEQNSLGYRDLALVASALARRSKRGSGALVLAVNGTVRRGDHDDSTNWKPALGISWTYAASIRLSLFDAEEDHRRKRKKVAKLEKHVYGDRHLKQKKKTATFAITEDDGFTDVDDNNNNSVR